MSGPVSTPAGVPKKSKAGLLIGLLVAAIVGGGAIFAVLFLFVFRDAPEKSEMTPNTAASASAAPTASVAAIATSATPVEAPPAATSAAPAVVEAKDALITLTCEPACDAVVCDKKPVANAAAGVRLLPGTHTCTGRKAGFASATITFTTTAGSDGAQTLTLTKNAAPSTGGGNKPPCGTFVNPCK
jgi:cytoskeletal protein RodZ